SIPGCIPGAGARAGQAASRAPRAHAATARRPGRGAVSAPRFRRTHGPSAASPGSGFAPPLCAMAPALRRFGRSVETLLGSDVREGEWHLVLLFFANLFLLLTAYYILKVIREPLILLGGGAVSRSYARGVQAGLLFAVIPAYSVLANRFEPARLVKWIFGVFV